MITEILPLQNMKYISKGKTITSPFGQVKFTLYLKLVPDLAVLGRQLINNYPSFKQKQKQIIYSPTCRIYYLTVT